MNNIVVRKNMKEKTQNIQYEFNVKNNIRGNNDVFYYEFFINYPKMYII